MNPMGLKNYRNEKSFLLNGWFFVPFSLFISFAYIFLIDVVFNLNSKPSTGFLMWVFSSLLILFLMLKKEKKQIKTSKGFYKGFLFFGITLIILGFFISRFVFARDFVLSYYSNFIEIFFSSIGISLIAAGMIKGRLGPRFNQLKPLVRSMLVLSFIGINITLNLTRILPIIYFPLFFFVLLGIVTSTISFKNKTSGLGILVFIESSVLLLVAILSYIVSLFG